MNNVKLKFKIQQYQTDAVENVVRVFDGQPNLGLLEYKIDHGKVYVEVGGKRVEVKELEYDEEDTGYKNGDIVLDEETLLKNIHHIQTESNIHLSNDVVKKLGHCQLDVEECSIGTTISSSGLQWRRFAMWEPSCCLMPCWSICSTNI